MQPHTQWPILAGTALATMALTFNALGVVAQDQPNGIPATPTGFAELDQALDASQPLKGKTVTMQTQWITAEGDDFALALAPFQEATGIDGPRGRGALGPARAAGQRLPQRRRRGRHHRARPASDHPRRTASRGSSRTSPRLMDPEKLTSEHAASIGLYSDR